MTRVKASAIINIKTIEGSNYMSKKEEYQEIYNLIKNGASNINAICKESEKSIKDINNILFMLEIDGFITKKQGEYKCI